VLPALDAPLLCRRALRFQRTAGAFRRPLVMRRPLPSSDPGVVVVGPEEPRTHRAGRAHAMAAPVIFDRSDH
jgi:hypothetical protein